MYIFSDFCPSGQELDSKSDQCSLCAKHYYKDNTVSELARFMMCTACPVDKRTPSTGSTKASNCSVGMCTLCRDSASCYNVF